MAHRHRAPARMADVLLVGFGAVGAMYSFIMERSMCARVTAVCRSNYRAVADHGISISSRKYGEITGWRPFRVFNSLSEALDRPYDFVVLSTKALPAVRPNSEILAPLLTRSYPYPQPIYVLMQNGLAVDRDLYEAASRLELGEPRIIIASLYIMANINDQHVVEHGDYEKIIVGVSRGDPAPRTENSREEEQTLRQFATIIESARSEIEVVPEIQAIKFSKNVWNAVFSSCATLTRYPLPYFFRNPEVEAQILPVIRAMFHEVVQVGRALGYDESVIPAAAVDMAIEGTAMHNKQADARHKPSMLLDLQRGQPLELEVILGELVRRARELHVDIPRIETMHALLTVLQAELLATPPQSTPVTPQEPEG